ncbi:UAA transporter family-domain-containing protein [Lactarius sanguifluus]|nr:UAA transporter family-domain-containing protein [Lactarius sanguifluus]
MSRPRQRTTDKKPREVSPMKPLHPNGSASASRGNVTSLAGALIDYSMLLVLVFGGCCSHRKTASLLTQPPILGPALTFSQMLFIAAQHLPSFVIWDTPSRSCPFRKWLVLATTFASGTLLNNLVFAFNVPLAVQIIFRSAGLAVSMLLGRVFTGEAIHAPTNCTALPPFFPFLAAPTTPADWRPLSLSLLSKTAVAVVSSGVVIATLSRPRAGSSSAQPSSTPAAAADASRYAIGVAMLLTSLVCTGVHGALQEHTYSTYGPHWREGVFYMHMLSLPLFALMPGHVRQGFVGLSSRKTGRPYTMLAFNLLSQLVCVTGVNQLSSRVSAVSTQVVLTARKAISLCFSVWWFGGGWNVQFACGAFMVFVGSFWYSVLPALAQSTATPTNRKKLT